MTTVREREVFLRRRRRCRGEFSDDEVKKLVSCDVFAPADVVLGAIIEEIGDRSCKDLSLQEVYALLLELKVKKLHQHLLIVQHGFFP